MNVFLPAWLNQSVRFLGCKSLSRIWLVLVFFVSCLVSGCVVVKVYEPGKKNPVTTKYYPGILFVVTPTNSQNFCISTKGIGFEKGLDGFTAGYHDLHAVVGLADNSVVIFDDKDGRTSQWVLSVLTNKPSLKTK